MRATAKSLALKVGRAEEQIASLESVIARWAETQSDSIYRVLEGGGRDHVYRVGKPEPFNPLWLVLFGEILYDLRSALDHLAHAIVPSPSPKTEFPIFCDEHGKHGFHTNAPAKLAGLPQSKPNAWDIIESLQPYQAAEVGRDPEDDPLWVLHQLNILDKHRYPLVGTSAVYQATSILMIGPGVEQPKYHRVKDVLDFVQDNRVATYRFSDAHPEIDLRAEFVLDVFFEEVADVDNPAIQTLGWLAEHVRHKVIIPLVPFL